MPAALIFRKISLFVLLALSHQLIAAPVEDSSAGDERLFFRRLEMNDVGRRPVQPAEDQQTSASVHYDVPGPWNSLSQYYIGPPANGHRFYFPQVSPFVSVKSPGFWQYTIVPMKPSESPDANNDTKPDDKNGPKYVTAVLYGPVYNVNQGWHYGPAGTVLLPEVLFNPPQLYPQPWNSWNNPDFKPNEEKPKPDENMMGNDEQAAEQPEDAENDDYNGEAP